MSADRRRRALTHARLAGVPSFDALFSYRRRYPTDLNVLRAMRAAVVWKGNSRREAFDQAAKYARWAWLPFRMASALLRYGQAARTTFGRGYLRQALDLLRVEVLSGLRSYEYYEGGLAQLKGSSELSQMIPYDLYASVTFALTLQHDRGSLALQLDKSLLELECRRRGLPVVRTLVIVDGDCARSSEGTPVDRLPEEDLVLKPTRGSQGRGVALYRWDGAGVFRDRGGAAWASADVLESVREQSRRSGFPWLLQRRALNSPALAGLSASALSTLRIVTVLDEAGVPEIVDAFYRTAVSLDAAADNYHAGGCWFPIDVESGVLKEGYRAGYESRPVSESRHPLTGAQVAGKIHPGAIESFELARKAHRAFSDLVVVGWDIGFGEDGPFIVEFNVPPGIDAASQRVNGAFANSRFGKLLSFHAARWLEANVSAGERWSFAAGSTGRPIPERVATAKHL